MCGIVGYIGNQNAVPILTSGLRRLEYRGYDSAGVAVLSDKRLKVLRCQGKLRNLEALVTAQSLTGSPGIGHTRWATHGRPSDANAHPHVCEGVAVVHNGIIENHLALKAELIKAGHVFSSETDSEIFAHLIADKIREGRDLPSAVQGALKLVQGTYAIAVLLEGDDSQIVVAKSASPLVLGRADQESFAASDIPALLEHTRDVIFLEDGDLAVLKRNGISVIDSAGHPVDRPARRVDWTPIMAEKGGHRHFMHKEIFEQPRAVADTIRSHAFDDSGDLYLETIGAEVFRKISRVVVVACGTSYHAGLCGKCFIESMARIPVEVDLASEFRCRDPVVDSSVLCIAVSQSGETLDTLAALREAKSKGVPTIALCNVIGSAIPREADATFYTHAGPEIGVASTKCFTTQVAAFYMLAVELGLARGILSREDAQQRLAELRAAPKLMERVLGQESACADLARKHQQLSGCLFLGRGSHYPIALEGALKLKEISYVHAEGYAAGEMKHGPIALIDPKLPVFAIAPKGPGYDKMLGNIQEVRARGGQVIAVASEGDERIAALADQVLSVPDAPTSISPLLTVLPLQLFAYHIADLRGTDVDQPRNLAKSVTVE